MSTVATTASPQSDASGPAIPVVPEARRKRSVVVYLCYGWLGLIILGAIFASVLPIADYDEAVGSSRLVPGLGSLDLLLGTDSYGRSMLSRIVYGAQVSLVVGTAAGLLGCVVGTLLGTIGGYFRGRIDWFVTLITDSMLAFPPLIMLLTLTSMLSPSVPTITVGLAIVTVPTFTRLTRATTISWSSREFVRAAKNMGAGPFRILTREILPNVLPTLGAYFPIVVAAMIVAEGSLSFLGLGVPPPQPSWGGMIDDAKNSLATNPHLVFIPAAVIFLTVFSLNQVGDHLRHRFDRTMQD
ncbi:peptide/nickel transport system permease protein [Prauserella sediminis]|uniref:Peptide/nickel transport system permease protein n=1 Tax=Prauserella sediminis TaxID=577680 RepID=A0A839XP53_9PSEU|nr:ABC transporter permease [Prauserella sediminis]MBB3665622.1 peptide/nickel transport system permease protein [Prauserella sediminis]